MCDFSEEQKKDCYRVGYFYVLFGKFCFYDDAGPYPSPDGDHNEDVMQP